MKRHHIIIVVVVLLLIGAPVVHVVQSRIRGRKGGTETESTTPTATDTADSHSPRGSLSARPSGGAGGSSTSATGDQAATALGSSATTEPGHVTTPGGPGEEDPDTDPDVDDELQNPLPTVAGGLRFRRAGMAGGIFRDVKRVANKNEVRVAVEKRGKARLVCILVEGGRRYAVLDRGASIDRIGRDFAAPPLPVAKTMSIYRSVAKRRIDYNAANGDFVVVVLCPVTDWDGLQLRWQDLLPVTP